jgi:hypothetical protein
MSAVQELLVATGGYQSKEVAGMIMAAFDRPAAALEWALSLQLALLQVPWPSELGIIPSTCSIHSKPPAPPPKFSVVEALCGGSSPAAGLVTATEAAPSYCSDSDGFPPDTPRPQLLFNGVRARVGLFHGPIDRVLPVSRAGGSTDLSWLNFEDAVLSDNHAWWRLFQSGGSTVCVPEHPPTAPHPVPPRLP